VTVAESFAPAPETSGTLRIVGLEPGQPECRILIVEDQRENWILLQRLLENAGFATRVVEDGLRAVEGFKSWRPHFIWMDLRLPVMNGMEAAKRIRALERGSEVKIAAVTASVFASQREEVLAAGFDDFLRKPYRPNEVFDCMARHLKLRYQYQWKPAPVAAETSTVLRPEDFSSLPANLRVELEDAVIALDHQRIARLVKRISEQDARLGRLLARFTDKLAYTPIFNALEKVQKITPAVLPPVK
jgi:CheY-like chemotaxis protein